MGSHGAHGGPWWMGMGLHGDGYLGELGLWDIGSPIASLVIATLCAPRLTHTSSSPHGSIACPWYGLLLFSLLVVAIPHHSTFGVARVQHEFNNCTEH